MLARKCTNIDAKLLAMSQQVVCRGQVGQRTAWSRVHGARRGVVDAQRFLHAILADGLGRALRRSRLDYALVQDDFRSCDFGAGRRREAIAFVEDRQPAGERTERAEVQLPLGDVFSWGPTASFVLREFR